MKFIKIILTILLISSYAYSGYKYDYTTGNQYSYYTDPIGTTHVTGYNFKTGHTWSSHIQKDGYMYGYDSNNDYWQYSN